MTRLNAIKLIVENISDDDILVHANGAISRESFFCKDREKNFYLLGSMGLASSVGLGFALCAIDQKVIILDGDGNILMGLGNLPLIGSLRPKNFIHIVLDNEVYGTTGNQPTISSEVDLSEISRVSGYHSSHLIHGAEEFTKIFRKIYGQAGPHFIHFKVNQKIDLACARIPYSAEQIRDRFINS
jgi:sulfopyruvate decarboxylase subunit beta